MMRLVMISHIIKNPCSSQEAKNCPEWKIQIPLTLDSCPLYCMLCMVGKGRSSDGLGSLGIRLLGSILSFFFLTRGHKYKSKHLSNLSFIKGLYAATFRKHSNFCGMKFISLSSGSLASHSSLSSFVKRYSALGL